MTAQVGCTRVQIYSARMGFSTGNHRWGQINVIHHVNGKNESPYDAQLFCKKYVRAFTIICATETALVKKRKEQNLTTPGLDTLHVS